MPIENEDNEAELRLRQLNGDTPGPENAHQEARVPPKKAPEAGQDGDDVDITRAA